MSHTNNGIFPIFPKAAKPDAEKSEIYNIWFKRFWLFALFLMTINLSALGFGNVNNIEKGLFLVAGIFFVIKNPLNRAAIFGGALIFFSIIFFGLFAESYEHSWGRSISALVALFSMLIFTTATPSQEDRMFMLRTISLLAVAIVIYSLILFALLGNPLFKMDHTGAMRLGGSTLPAFLAAAAYTSSLASILMYSFTRNNVYFLLVILNLVIGMLSGTRMAFLCSAFTVFFALILPLRGIFLKIAIAVVFSITGSVALLTVGNQILIRFMSGSLSGRNLIQDVLIDSISKHPLAGVGFGHHGALIPESVKKFTGTVAAHNEYVRLAVELGYVGAGLFILGLVIISFKEIKQCNMVGKFLLFLNMSVLMLYASTDNVFFLTYLLLALIVISNCTPIFSTNRQTT